MNSSPGDFSPAFGCVSPEGFGQPLCLMSPIGRKASVEGGISPSDLAHSPLPPTSCSSPKSVCFFGSYRRLRKNLSLASLQLRKLSFHLRRFAVLAWRCKRTVHPAISPWPLAGVTGKAWTAIVPDEPYRAKGLCEREISPSHLAHSPLPPILITPSELVRSSLLGPSSQNQLTCLLQLCKLSFHYGSLLVLLNNPNC